MRVGMAVIFQNPGDARPDADVYAEELALAELAEPLGFDSIWSVEHHFTDYTTEYRALYRELNGASAPPTIAAGWTFCDPDEGRARELAERHIGGYWRTVLRHYELGGDHFARAKGYEFYERMSDAVSRHGAAGVTDFLLSLQVWGTPEQCYAKVCDIRTRVGCDTFVGVFSYAEMPREEAERNARLFAREVMPELRRQGAP